MKHYNKRYQKAQFKPDSNNKCYQEIPAKPEPYTIPAVNVYEKH